MRVIDASVQLPMSTTVCMQSKGVECVIRYYTSIVNSHKLLTRAEAVRIAASGLSLAVVYQDRNRDPENFSKDLGAKAGAAAFQYARDVIGQPFGSAIYFGVDTDFLAGVINGNVVPYFQGVAEAFSKESSSGGSYQVGVYGSGLVCTTLLSQSLVSYCWLPGASKWLGTAAFLKSNRWHLRQIAGEKPLCGVSVDENIVNDLLPDYGQFKLPVPAVTAAIVKSQRFTVIARSGLRLRGGPGTGFDILRLLPAGSSVSGLREQDGWMQVDCEGDGMADGWASAGFLRADGA